MTAETGSLFEVRTPSLVDPGEGQPFATTEDRFQAFHRANPGLLREIIRLAREAKSRGRKVGIKAIFERLRWEYLFRTTGDEAYRLNNNFTAYYARLAMETAPDLEGFFETRVQRSVARR